jgi:hypothetical protein
VPTLAQKHAIKRLHTDSFIKKEFTGFFSRFSEAPVYGGLTSVRKLASCLVRFLPSVKLLSSDFAMDGVQQPRIHPTLAMGTVPRITGRAFSAVDSGL